VNVTVEDVENNFRFPGQYYDSETELHYNWHRYYNPNTGRYLTPDPLNLGNVQIGRQSFQIAFHASVLYYYGLVKPQVLNPYPYAQNRPTILVDPTGEFVQSLAAGGIAGGIVGGITFVTALAKGESVSDATKSALISGGTSAVSVGLASSGVGVFAAGSVAAFTNAALQKIVKGDVKIGAALFSGFATSAGGLALSGAGLQGATLGVVTGQVNTPVSLIGDVLFSSDAQEQIDQCE
jgi:RHS repeat-associated protein